MVALSEREFHLLADQVYDHCGLNLREKKHLIENRLGGLLTKFHLNSFSDLYQIMKKDESGDIYSDVVDRLSTNHTYFMRETRHFEFFKAKVLPELKAKIKNRDLRIWSAGCSSGQEAYTLAMILSGFFSSERPVWDTKILATDISLRALDKAREAVYDAEDINNLPLPWRVNYFEQLGNGKKRVIESLRQEVILRRFNLLENTFPFKQRFHVIFCRNVMIYFDMETKKKVVKRFNEFMDEGGYLFIGQAESLNWEGSQFKYVIPGVYRKE